MNYLFFLDQRLAGTILYLNEPVENGKIPLLHESDWFWAQSTLFNCIMFLKDADSRVLRINLMNLFVSLVNQQIAVKTALAEVKKGNVALLLDSNVLLEKTKNIIRPLFKKAEEKSIDVLYAECLDEIKQMIAVSRTSPICYWTYGDDAEKERFDQHIRELGSMDRIKNLLALPHYVDLYRHTVDAEKLATVRYEASLKSLK